MTPLHPCGQMELQAVASVVIQKVNDMLPDEITDKKETVKALEELQSNFADADEEQRNSREFKSWAEECVKILYDVEETVESFALGIARQNKKGGFLMKHFPVFKNFKAGQNLRSKMKRIPSNIERVIHIYPTPLPAVASAVIQKVNDMLPDEIMDKKVIVKELEKLQRKTADADEITDKKVIVKALEKLQRKIADADEIMDKKVIVKALEKLQRKIADTDEEQRNSKEFKSWAEECLKSLYDVEETVESFALGIARQNKKGGFLMKHFPVFKNFKAGQNLRSKMKRIPSNIERVIHIYPTPLPAVTSVVIQKVNDKLPDEITEKKVIVKALEELQRKIADADEEQRNGKEFKSWAEECLKSLYDVEEIVDSFALGISRQNKKGGVLMKHFPVFKNFKAGQNLRSKMKRIPSNIERVIHIYPTPLPAAASAVIQKVNDMLPDELMDKKVIVKELEKLQRKTADADEITDKKVIVKALEKLQRKIADADEIMDKKVIVKALEKLQRKIDDTDKEQRNSKEFKGWAEECLKSLYDVEDTVESFALGIARQNKKGGFLMRHFPVFKNFKAGQNLRSKMKRIPSNIERVIHIYPTPLHPCGQMELQAVASVVIQKVNNMLPDEITDKKVIVKELEKLQRKTADADEITVKKVIVKALENLQRKIADADDIMEKKVIVKALGKLEHKIADTDEEQRNSKEFKSWAGECLKSLYDVEDTVESFALGIARQNKKGGFVIKNIPVFKNFKAGQNLRSKMKRIPANIERLIHIYPTPLHPCGQMELQEVASVVIQKVNGMLPDEITDKKVIVKALEKLQRKIADTDEEQRNSKEFKSWAEECLKSLYDVEETVESFALGIARQNKKGGFLMKHFPVFKNFKAGQNLRSKMKRINSNIERVIHIYPKGTKEQHGCSNVTNTSLDGHNSEDSEDKKVGLLSAMEHRSYPTIPESVEEELGEDSRELTKSLSNRSLRLEHEKEAKFMHRNISLRCSSFMSLRLDRKEQPRLLHTDSYHDGELEMFTIRQEVDDLVERLTQTDDDGRVLIIQIAGESGSGKTTLARAVYGSRKVKNHFKSGCAWVTISKESKQSAVLQNLLKQVDSKNYLIVLDDVQSDQTWEWLKSLDHQNGSTRLLITTTPKCIPKFPRNVKSYTHNVKRLSEKYIWSLFLKKAGWEEGMEHQDLKQRVLNVCCGLPHNIVLLGSMLSTKEGKYRLDYLQKILHSKTEDIVSLSYTDLPYHLKMCVLYLVLFPKEYDIPVRRLLRLWLSEGFVNCKPEIFPEDVVQENFDDLVQRSLIQISKLTSDGSPKRCRLQGVLHDYLLPKAENISLFHAHSSTSSGEDSVPPNVRRLVEHASSENVYTDATRLEHLRSYLSFNFQRKDVPAKEVGSLLSHIITKGFGLLRVLDLEGVYKPSLPENLGDLFLLRYLGLRWTFLDVLPSSVSDLPYLETLDVKHTNINNLPTSMWKLKHLRHLNLSHIRLDMPKHSDCGSLPELLTLWGLSVDDESPVKNGLDQLHNLREAGITFCLSNCEDLLNWISGLTSLQSLRLRSKNDIGHPSHFGDKPLSLSSLSNLSHLNLLGELPKLPEKLPEGLKVVTLSLSKLTEDPMPILGKLGQLNVLRLLSDSYMGKKLVCPQGGFKELRVLNLWKLKNLEEWNMEERALGKLKEINIRCCYELMSIPSGLMKQTSLKELVITNMPEKFIQYVDKFTRIQQVILTRKDYVFTPLQWEHADDTCDGVRSIESHTE